MESAAKWSRWTDQERDVVRSLFGKVPVRVIRERVPGRTYCAITHQAHLMGLRAVGSEMAAKTLTRYTHDKSFFTTPNPTASYWAGFLAADGCIFARPRGISLSVQIGDGAHIQHFAQAIGFTGPLISRTAWTGHQEQIGVRVWGAHQLVADLARNYNITPRKSLTLEPPVSLDTENSLAFIVGLIDGDGCIRLKKPSGRRPATLALSIAGTERVLLWTRDHLERIAPTWHHTSRVRRHTHGNLFYYEMFGRRAAEVVRTVSALPLPYLARKWTVSEATT